MQCILLAMGKAYDPAEIGERLRLVREASGMKSGELAELLGVSSSAIANWENGRQRPSLPMAERICQRFRITLDWLFLGRPDHLPYDVVKSLAAQSAAGSKANPG